jgi:hypothetical protein
MWEYLSKNEKGQSSIEFLFTFAIALTLVFMFVGVAINYGSGYLVHYATFMASRAYLSTDPGAMEVEQNISGGPGSAEDAARSVFAKYKLHRVKKKIKASKLQFNHPLETKIYEYVGVYYEYDTVLSPIKTLTGNTKIKYKSESFLGKEPVRADCYKRICKMMVGLDNCAVGTLDITMYDNGC